MLILSAFGVVIGQYKWVCWPSIASTFVIGAERSREREQTLSLPWQAATAATSFACKHESSQTNNRSHNDWGLRKLFIPNSPVPNHEGDIQKANCFKLLIKSNWLSWEWNTKRQQTKWNRNYSGGAFRTDGNIPLYACGVSVMRCGNNKLNHTAVWS